jgi:hypothetical protein
MIEGPAFLRNRRSLWAAVSAFVIFGCMGGTGTDTENGVYVSAQVIDSSDKPVANVEVTILDLSARADSSSSTPLVDQNVMLTTDDSGRVNFFLKKNGSYMAAGKRGDSVLFIDTLKTKAPVGGGSGNPGGLGNPTFKVERPVQATGKLRLHSGLLVDTGRVLVRGTKIESAIRDSGAYNLGWLPSKAQDMNLTVTYEGRIRQTRYVKVSAQGSQLTVHFSTMTGRCQTDSISAVTPAQTTPGSLSSKADLARLVGKSCAPFVGTRVRLLEINGSGTVTRSLGEYVIPSPNAPKIWDAVDSDSSAVPTACIESEKNLNTGLTGRSTLRLSNRDILVDDFKSGKGCLQ